MGGAHPRPSPRPSAETSSTINLLSVIAVLVAVSRFLLSLSQSLLYTDIYIYLSLLVWLLLLLRKGTSGWTTWSSTMRKTDPLGNNCYLY